MKRTARLAGAAAGLLVLTGAAIAQVPPEVAAKIRAAGQSMDPSIGQLYAPMFPEGVWSGIEVVRDVEYGTDPLQKLDVYAPEGAQKNLPVLLFVHGGGFTRGDKHGEFYPDNITMWGARQGMIGVNINYRLAPQNPWPAGAQDLASAIAWTRANIAQFGGDPGRIILWGHSAGANHVADYVAHPEVHGSEIEAVEGAVLLSPFYSAEENPEEPHVYYGTNQTLQSSAASVERLRQSTIPLFIAHAEFDPEPFKIYANTMRQELCESASGCPEHVYLEDHNHFTEGMAVGTADQSLTGPLLEWIKARG